MGNKKKPDYILTSELSLEDFLSIIKNPLADKFYYPTSTFPTTKHIDEFISKIQDLTEEEFKAILRHFIPKSGTYGKDIFMKDTYSQWNTNIETIGELEKTFLNRIKVTEYYQKLIKSNDKIDVWEGITWILDLLPHWPNKAIDALDAYFLANCQFFPDNSLSAIGDCTALIRARYIDKEQPREIFLNLTPIEFERLVASIYKYIGYEIRLTKQSYDGGIDIYAEKNISPHKEKLIIQCKNYTSNVTVDEVRTLLGVTMSTKSTKGVLVTSSKFTKEAIKFANDNPSIELINHEQLSKLFNENHGPYWIYKIDNYLRDIK
jgi:restriction system protein